jgi:hypothetical protein
MGTGIGELNNVNRYAVISCGGLRPIFELIFIAIKLIIKFTNKEIKAI